MSSVDQQAQRLGGELDISVSHQIVQDAIPQFDSRRIPGSPIA